MAETLHDGEFWLPSHFLTDDDMLMSKGSINKNGVKTDIKVSLGFPTEFPYEFGLFSSNSSLSSPVESVVGSTETESDEEDFLALSRQLAHSTLQETQKFVAPKFNTPEKLEKTWVMAGSPQSTLSGIGSWSGRSAVSSNGSPNGSSQVSSPPTTPLSTKNDAWDLIYAAAGQVARLKMSGEGPPKYQQGRGLLGPPRNPTQVPLPPLKNPNNGFYSNEFLTQSPAQRNQFQQVKHEQVLNQQVKQCSSVCGRQAKAEWFSQQNQLQQQQIQNRGRSVGYENERSGRPLGLPQSAWPPLQARQQQHQQQNSASAMRAVFLGGSSVRRESTGTGVFLPRRYNNTTDSRKKPGCSTVLLPARVVQALNLNFEDMNAQSQQRFNVGFTADYDALMARRNALLTQQKQRNFRPEGGLSHEICLPQEWTY